MTFFYIITNIILPIFVIVAIGFFMDRKFRFDLDTLSKLTFHVFLPALLFVKLLKANITGPAILSIGLLTVAQMAVLFALAMSACVHPVLKPYRSVLTMGSLFNNCGNYGIPLIAFAFPDDPALLGALAIIIAIQLFASATFGIWFLARSMQSTLNIFKGFAVLPMVHAPVMALLLKYFRLEPVPQIFKPLEFLSDALVAAALLTLGAQLSRSIHAIKPVPITAISFMRLIASPLLTAAMLPFFGIELHSSLAAMIIIIAGMPVAVNVYILAAAYNHDAALASQTIFWTTLFSPVTLAVLLAIYK